MSKKQFEERKAFKFYRSYAEVFWKLPEDQRLSFIEALLSKQFKGEDPEGLEGMAEFAYMSQKHSIEAQVKGWKDRVSSLTPKEAPSQGGVKGGSAQEQEKAQVKVKGKEEYKHITDLRKDYLNDHQLVKAVVANQKLKSPAALKEYISQFNEHLSTTGSTSKTWSDYASHFLNWLKKRKTHQQLTRNPDKRQRF